MKTKRILSLVLVGTLFATMAVGCGKKDTDTASSNTSTASSASSDSKDDEKLSNEKITIKYWKPFYASQFIKSLDESLMYEELEKRTNVHVEFIHPAEGQETEQFNIMMNSKELPDVIEQYPARYKGGPDKGIEDGAFLKLNDLIDKYAPNYKKLREEDKELARQTITDKGNIYCFALIGEDKNEPAWWGPVVRKDWLKELGITEPTTIDEWHDMLKAFQEKKKVEAPLVLSKYGYDGYGTIISAFDIGPGFYRKDGKIRYSFMEEGFKNYLDTMNKWYKEGLIDKDFATRDKKSREAMITSGKAGVFMTEYGLVDQYQAAIKSTDSKAEYAPLTQPSLKKGEKVHYRVVNNRNGGYEAAITTSCKNPARVAQWLDYAYGKEGYMLFNYGIEGVSYKMVDGKPKFTEALTDNKDGLDFWAKCNKYKLDVGPYLRNYKAIPEFTKIDLACMDEWTKPDDAYVIPPINFSDEESEKESTIMGDINTFVQEKILAFIIGKEPISKFDDFAKQLKDMNIEEVIKIYQDALDRYEKR